MYAGGTLVKHNRFCEQILHMARPGKTDRYDWTDGMLETNRSTIDAVVVGAGQAGLAAGYYLQRAGVHFVILEAGPQAAGSWPHYYNSLRLFSPARYASLPGLPFPGSPDHYPARDEVVAYLARYADHFQLPVRTNTPVLTVERSQNVFEVTAKNGVSFRARSVIAATGSFQRPYMPHISGMTTYQGRVLHSAAYRTPDAFREQRIVVVGGGNSAVQIAVELARHARVTLASRKPIKFTQRLLGRDIHWWSDLVGLERVPFGRWVALKEANPVLDTGTYRAAIAHDRPRWRPMFRAFDAHGVVWQDGSTEPVDAVIFATGFRPNLDYLEPLGALAPNGRPRQHAGVSTTTPGLYYVGLAAQRTFVSSTLRGVGADAGFVVKHLCRYLRTERREPRHEVV
jgi:putative flavoprotein involved in K+ transport